MIMEDNGLEGLKELSPGNLKLFLDTPHIRTQYLPIKIQRNSSCVKLRDFELPKNFPVEM
jgi:hypothetical protein